MTSCRRGSWLSCGGDPDVADPGKVKAAVAFESEEQLAGADADLHVQRVERLDVVDPGAATGRADFRGGPVRSA